MPTIISGDGTITGLTATGISAVQNLPAGSVKQVVQSTTSTQATTTSSSFSSTGFTGTITPSATSSKIYINITGSMNGNASGDTATFSNWRIYYQIGGGAITALTGTSRGEAVIFLPINSYVPLSLAGLHTPTTTSAITYYLYFKRESGNSDVSFCRDNSTQAQMTLMEIAG